MNRKRKNTSAAFLFHRHLPLFLPVLLLAASGCETAVRPDRPTPGQQRAADENLRRIFSLRKLRFAALPALPGGAETEIAREIARQLGLELFILRTGAENIPPLLRAGKLDFASGSFSEDETRRLRLDPLVLVSSAGTRHVFALPRGSTELGDMLRRAFQAADERGLTARPGGGQTDNEEEYTGFNGNASDSEKK